MLEGTQMAYENQRRNHLTAFGAALLVFSIGACGAGTGAVSPSPTQGRGPVTGGATGGGSSSTERFVSPSVVASWMLHWRASDGDSKSLLVLWRGTPGWFTRPSPDGRHSSGGGSGSTAWQTFTEGGITFELDYDFDRNVVTMLKQQVSLKDANVVLVDFVDSPDGAQIVDRMWIETPPEQQPPMPDPIAAIVKSSSGLYEFLRCDVSLPNANAYLSDVMAAVCAQMRP
jgi:hypothetical protein